MYFRPFTVRVGAEQRGFESGAPRPVLAIRQTVDGETELLLSTDEGGLSWVDRGFAQAVEMDGLAVEELRKPRKAR